MDLLDRVSALHPRFDVRRDLAPELTWIPCEALHDPAGSALADVREAERVGSGHVSDHTTALTLAAVYSCTVTAAAVAGWALTGQLIEARASTMAISLGDHHGFEAVGVREVRVTGASADQVVEQILADHLLPLAAALEASTRASRRQLLGGVAQGCAEAFGIASRHGDVDSVEASYRRFVKAAPVDLDDLGSLVRLREGDREGLDYLRNTCCLTYTSAEATLCASCCLTPEADRIERYRETLRR